MAGSDAAGDGGPALQAQLAGAECVAVDRLGNLYISDSIDHRVRKVLPGGVIITVAGNGHPGFKGDGGPAAAALLNSPYGLAVDQAGNLYIADLGNGRVRRVSPDGVISTVAGGGQGRPGSDGGNALASKIAPRNVAVAPDGTLYISDFTGHRIYKVSRDGRIWPLAGGGVEGRAAADEPLATAQLNAPAGLAVDAAGAVYFADSGNNAVRKIERGRVTIVLGGGNQPAALSAPTGVALDPAGNLYVVDAGNRRIWMRTPAGAASLLAEASGAPAVAGGARLEPPRDVAVDAAGVLYVAARRWVQKLTPQGVVLPAAGTGEFGFSGDGGPALEARLFYPAGVAVDGAGNLFIADQRNHRVRKVDPAGRISTLAGSGSEAEFTTLFGIAAEAGGRLWVSDEGAHRVRLISPAGAVETIAGTGSRGFSGDGGPAWNAQLFGPAGIAVDGAGNAYIADAFNHRVRKIAPNGVITTYAGRGVRGYGGDGGPAVEAQLDTPRGLALDAAGNLYIAEYANHCVRRVTAAGRIETVAGNGQRGYAGDGGPAVVASLNHPLGVAVDAAGNLFIADSDNHRIRTVSPDGVIRTVAGDGVPGFDGDGGDALAARLYTPAGLAAGAAGEIYVADFWNHRVRKLAPVIAAPVEEPPPAALQVLHAATLEPGPIAPGQLVVIPTLSAGAAEVLFDGAPAPVLSSENGRLTVQAPAALAGQAVTEIELRQAGAIAGRTSVRLAAASPGLFTVAGGKGQALALNQDGKPNSEANPAALGSVVTLYGTGEGVSGLPIAVAAGDYPTEMLYAGAAPGYPGLLQVNVRLPAAGLPAGPVPVILWVGSAPSPPGVTLAVR